LLEHALEAEADFHAFARDGNPEQVLRYASGPHS
jgi:hypothetical protein